MHWNFEYDVSCHKMWIAKQKVLELLFGTPEEFFQMLHRILLALKESNLGMVIKWDKNNNWWQ
jgi:hypothetical protein